ncbi:MAG: hypothetical protein B6D72_04345 [gamma proteobacterium symbiont of Ctena orbiculata]|nr:DUF2061 domain-containing protein [Candidatus Thiodiazotropha taylori]PVV14247.1 MAG: hypothetical protein B6D72_04345 [gamma proteobacterium symbiont of Ctena orbiculata]MBT2995528.1 DUF2061 domain-containing protein [Candidatus Thiodiazotropha taylori]MBT2999518.1 DUF2061 domain-containing protein [Candidatus Thiodiazotropha taylori]MBV2106611.1 DUF2061 domain-containing protein [Candidatus Thiodiazotropha taylori]
MFLTFADNKAEKRSRQAVSSERPIRSLTKAISWRVTGSIDTILLSWFFTGSLTTAAAIGLTEVVTKMVLYYLHERVWNRISLGRSEMGHGQKVAVLKEGPAVASSGNC